MLKIRVSPPRKTSQLYEFRYTALIQGESGITQKARAAFQSSSCVIRKRTPYKFGFRAVNFEILHSELWDSIYPLMYLIRNGGPLFDKFEAANIRFEYPVLESAADFFITRAKNFGINLSVEGPRYTGNFEIETAGNCLTLGGGKDSRLLYGILNELGQDPVVFSSLGIGNQDYTGNISAKRSEPIGSFALANRIFPALMSGSETIYFGLGLGECYHHEPWVQYYDFSPRPLRKFSDFLQSVGLQTECIAPLSVLPYNIIQKILFERYPELYSHQISTGINDRSEKNLHVALCKAYHGIDFKQYCSEKLFRALLRKFIRTQATGSFPGSPIRQAARKFFRDEMKVMIFKMRDQPLFKDLGYEIPAEWNGEWINYIHDYVYPSINKDFLGIISEYAESIECCPPEHLYKIAVNGAL